jgi:hypothetical protein
MLPPARIIKVAFAAFAACAGLASACNWPPTSSNTGSSSTGTASVPTGDPPILDALNMSATALVSGSEYVVTGSITFHCDDDGVVSEILVNVPVIGKTITVTVNDEASAVGQPFTFQLPDDVPLTGAGATTYIVTLVTKGGAQSTPADESVILQ